MTGHNDDIGFKFFIVDEVHDFITIHSRHHQIKESNVDFPFGQLFHSVFSTTHGRGMKPLFVKKLLQKFPKIGIIIHNQYFR